MNETKKIHFNVIDLIIVIVIIGCIVGFALRKETKTELENARDSVTYAAFIVSNVAPEAVDTLAVGDILFSSETTNRIGEVVYCDKTPYKRASKDMNGHQQISLDETNCDIYGIIKIEGVDTDNGYFIGGTEYIGVNSGVNCDSERFHATASIMQISEDVDMLRTFVSEIVENPLKYEGGEA